MLPAVKSNLADRALAGTVTVAGTVPSEAGSSVSWMTAACAEPISVVIAEDTGLPEHEARMLGIALVGQAQVTARWWLTNGRPIPREDAARLVFSLSWRGIRGFPKHPA